MVNSKQKGKRAELEVVNILKAHGYDARRSAQYCGNTGDAADVVGIPGIHAEVKHQERMQLYEWMAQAIRDASQDERKPKPTVIHRKNNAEWLITMRFEDFLEIYDKFISIT